MNGKRRGAEERGAEGRGAAAPRRRGEKKEERSGDPRPDRLGQIPAAPRPRVPASPHSASPSWVIAEHEAGQPLDRWLAGQPALGSRSKARAAIGRGKVFLNDCEVTPAEAGQVLSLGDVVRLWLDRPGSAKRRPAAVRHRSGLRVVFEDEFLLVADKPPGLLVHPVPDDPPELTLIDLVETYLRPRGKRRPLLVHRIDRNTSGLVLFATDAQTQERLKEQFKRREPERVYWAVVHGAVEPKEGTWEDRLTWDPKHLIQRRARPGDPQAKQAVARYRVLEQFKSAALLEVRLVTGKRNQIRAQAAWRGLPLVGERQYVRGRATPSRPAFERQALHALRLAFTHPYTGKPLAFEAPLPEDIARLLAELRMKH